MNTYNTKTAKTDCASNSALYLERMLRRGISKVSWFIAFMSLLLIGTLPLLGQTESVLYSFCAKANCADGATPTSSLVLDAKGNIYGTTADGGAFNCGKYGCGTVFRLSPSGVEAVLYSFAGQPDGATPSSGLTPGPKSAFGVTRQGGAFNNGAIFELSQSGTTVKETVLYSFTGGSDGGAPSGNLALDTQAGLYGTTVSGGVVPCAGGFPMGCGTVFELGSIGDEEVLYAFPGGDGGVTEPYGAAPLAGVIRDAEGDLYGTTTYGGAHNFGTVFEVSAPGTEEVLYSFLDSTDGGLPSGSLIRDENGNLYGTARIGGNSNSGTVFELNENGDLRVLHSFSGSPNDGSQPVAGLVADKAGNLYGTTFEGGTYGYGTVFEVTSTGVEKVLYNFKGGSDGSAPGANLVIDKDGNLYGTTPEGGAYNSGTVFKLVP